MLKPPADILTGLFLIDAYTEDTGKIGSIQDGELEVKIAGGATVKVPFKIHILPCELISATLQT